MPTSPEIALLLARFRLAVELRPDLLSRAPIVVPPGRGSLPGGRPAPPAPPVEGPGHPMGGRPGGDRPVGPRPGRRDRIPDLRRATADPGRLL